MSDLAEATGQTARNIRYLITEGIVPKPEGFGKGAVYSVEHVDALRRYESLKAAGVTSISTIRDAMSSSRTRVLGPVDGIVVVFEDAVGLHDEDAVVKRVETAVRKALENRKDS
ncbi:helix-turn-helix domain-containing protein [Roseibium sp. RKSG952]|uniref:helix-turn-helix domain-containing protein n=1 Tax=Roseibium sp. RKSG952 TaxID=2529384 RepID=UPI0018AD236D|nr:helix-turn-helix domain-containing protein [Roseibium sp. RKSG952]